MENNLIILNHFGVGDIICLSGMVNFYLTKYNSITIICKKNRIDNLKILFNNNVNFFPVDHNNYKKIKKNIEIKYKNFDKLYLGYFKRNTWKTNDYDNIPYVFYNDANIPKNIFWNYNKIPILEDAVKLYEKIKNFKIIFVHNISFYIKKKFNLNQVLKLLNIDEDNYLLINPDINLYDNKSEKYYLANLFVGKPILHYTKIIENAEYNILLDSSFFCLSIHLNIKTNNNYFVSRGFNYEKYLWDENNGFDLNLKKIFKKINVKLIKI